MKVIIAPDSFKESLSAQDVALQIRDGFAQIYPQADYVLLPVADGGEGTVDAMIAAMQGTRISKTVTGPLGRQVEAFYGLSGDKRTAIIEMAAAAGLSLVPPPERNPLVTTTYGVGELIKAALDDGARHLIIGIGGSSTNDGGAGMAQALGIRLLDKAGRELPQGAAGLGELQDLDLSGLDRRIADCRIDVACDVDNPLVGPHGASEVFGPQKGATPEMVTILDQNLRHFGHVIHRQLGIEVNDMPGAGGAGGLGAGLHAFLGARLRRGIEIVIETIGLEADIANADIVITGEGRMDGQTAHGKAPVGVAALARKHQKPVIAIVGSLGDGAEVVHQHHIGAVFSVMSRPCSVAEALDNAAANIKRTARNVAATLQLSRFGDELKSLELAEKESWPEHRS